MFTISSEMLSTNCRARNTQENRYGKNVSLVTWVFGEYWIRQQMVMFHRSIRDTNAKQISRPYQEMKLVWLLGAGAGVASKSLLWISYKA